VTDQDLIEQYIEPNPDRVGAANARITGYSVPVWALVGYLEAVHGDVTQVAHDYGLPVNAVEAALAYYEAHRDFIDDRLAANAG
jgi:uncharacterized protein (DUF433 family)